MSIRFLADADLNRFIVSATRQREPSIDFLSTSLKGMKDPEVLERVASEGRIVVSHDRRNMPVHFRARLESGRMSPGLLIVPQRAALGPIVEAIALIWAASDPSEWTNQIFHLPSLARHVFYR